MMQVGDDEVSILCSKRDCREVRGMIPTAKTLNVLGPLCLALGQVRSGHNTFSPTTSELTVSIACTVHLEAAVVVPLIMAVRDKAPSVRIAVHLLNPSTLNQQLADGDADLAIATPDSSQPHLRTRHLFEIVRRQRLS